MVEEVRSWVIRVVMGKTAKEGLEELSRLWGTTKSEAIRRAVREALQREKTPSPRSLG
jgi:hypothetical protein